MKVSMIIRINLSAHSGQATHVVTHEHGPTMILQGFFSNLAKL